MQFFDVNRILLGIVAVRVIAAAIFMIVVPLLDQPAVADQSAAAPTIVPQQPPIADSLIQDSVQDFADRIALAQRLWRLEQQIQTLLNTAPTIVPQQPSIADPPADRMALDQRLRTLEQQIQTLLNTRERAVQTRTETTPESWVRLKQTTTKHGHRRRHEIDGTALPRETVDANPGAHPGITKASGCRGSVPCVERETAPFTERKATREYDEAGNEIK
jgi:hypothetical protein